MTTSQWLMTIILAVLALEIITGRHKNIYKKEDVIVTVAAFLATRAVTSPLIAFCIASFLAFAFPGFHNALSDAPVIPAAIIMILVGEFLLYWVHRWSHNALQHPILHGMHRTHHAATYLNITVMGRINLFWPLVHPYGWVSGIALYLGMVEASAIFFLLLLAWNAFTHSDFRWDDLVVRYVPAGEKWLRVIEWVFVTPRLHHTHHGYGRDGKGYRNFCTMITIYDRLFGTLYTPSGRPDHYGILGRHRDWKEQLFFPLINGSSENATNNVLGAKISAENQ